MTNTWTEPFERRIESRLPWLSDVQLGRLVIFSLGTTILMAAARWHWVPGLLGALPWLYVWLFSLPGPNDGWTTNDRDATRRVCYLWTLNLLPLVPLLVPTNLSDVLFGMRVPEAPLAASLVTPALLFWLWVYASRIMRLHSDQLSTGTWSRIVRFTLDWLLLPTLGLFTLSFCKAVGLRVFYIAHTLTLAWLIFRRVTRSAHPRRNMIPRVLTFSLLRTLQLFAWVDMLLYYVEEGDAMRFNDSYHDQVWYFVERFVFVAGFAGTGIAMAAVAEDVDGK